MDIDRKDVLLAWGSTVTLGWLATLAMGMLSMTIGKVLVAWVVLMAVPVGMTAYLYISDESSMLLNFWAVAVTVLMAENILAPAGLDLYSYFHLWFVASAAGFYFTSRQVPEGPDRTYRIASVLSLAGLGIVAVQPFLAVPLGVILQGAPILYDWNGMRA